MPVTPVSYEAVALSYILAALHASPTYSALGGSTATTILLAGDDAGNAVYSVAGTPIDFETVPIVAHVGAEPFSLSPVSAGTPRLYFRNAELPIKFRLRNTPADSPADRMIRALNAAGLIRQEIEALATGATQWQRIGGTVQIEQAPPPGALDAGHVYWTLTLSLGDDL
jgi:hypothetical protein